MGKYKTTLLGGEGGMLVKLSCNLFLIFFKGQKCRHNKGSNILFKQHLTTPKHYSFCQSRKSVLYLSVYVKPT